MSNSPRVMSSALFAVLVCGLAASAVACGSPEEKKKSAWSCVTDEVPMGEVVRCTSSALTADGPVTDGTGGGGAGSTTDGTTTDGTTTDATGGGAGGDSTTEGSSDGSTTYECGPEGGEDCPPVDTSGSGGAGGGSTSDGTSDEGSSSTTGGGGAGSTAGDGTPGNGNGNGGGSGTNNGNGNQSSDGASSGPSNSGGGGGSSHKPGGPDECSYVPDLPYCGGTGGSGGTADGTSDGTSSGGGAGSDCGKPNCTPPGQDKKGGTGDGTSNGGASSGGGGGASNGGGGGKHWKCTKDKDGNKSCTSTPDCASGTHPSSCGACVSDSDGAGDCVPPSAGGCWVTGGGFIIADSLTPAAPADGHDNFGGNAKPMKDGTVKGHWNHVDHGTGNHATGRPEYIFCRKVDGPGPGQPGGKKGLTANQVYFGGHARWRSNGAWAEGYWFDVVANDHGEPGRLDKYHFSIRKIDDPAAGASGTVVYDTKGVLVGGNIQLHPPNNGHPAVSSPLPAWVALEP